MSDPTSTRDSVRRPMRIIWALAIVGIVALLVSRFWHGGWRGKGGHEQGQSRAAAVDPGKVVDGPIPGVKVCADQVVVRVEEGVGPAEVERLAGEAGCEVVGAIPRSRWYQLRLREGQDMASVLERLRSLPEVEYCRENAVGTLEQTAKREWPNQPDDAAFQRYEQQCLQRILDYPQCETWQISRGSPEVRIGVVDTGVDRKHPDLRGKVVDGWDVLGNDRNYSPELPLPLNYHGTRVAGVCGAKTNNGREVASLGWDCSLVAIRAAHQMKALEVFYWGEFQLGAGIEEAVQRGCRVVNVSGGVGLDWSWALESPVLDAVQHAMNKGVLVVAAASNSPLQPSFFPAAYARDYANVMAVAASDFGDKFVLGYGAAITVGAPGAAVRVLEVPGAGTHDHGTSFAAPFVSALAGLIWSLDLATNEDFTLRPYQVRDIICDSCDKTDDRLGAGRINAYQALVRARAVLETPIEYGETPDEQPREFDLSEIEPNEGREWRVTLADLGEGATASDLGILIGDTWIPLDELAGYPDFDAAIDHFERFDLHQVDLQGDGRPEILVMPRPLNVRLPGSLMRHEGRATVLTCSGSRATLSLATQMKNEYFQVRDVRDLNGDGLLDVLIQSDGGASSYMATSEVVWWDGQRFRSQVLSQWVRLYNFDGRGALELGVMYPPGDVNRRLCHADWLHWTDIFMWNGECFVEANHAFPEYLEGVAIPDYQRRMKHASEYSSSTEDYRKGAEALLRRAERIVAESPEGGPGEPPSGFPPLPVDVTRLPMTAQGEIVDGETHAGTGIKVTVSGSRARPERGTAYSYSVSIEPGDGVTGQKGSKQPRSIRGQGASHIVIAAPEDGVELSNLKVRIDGVTDVEAWREVFGLVTGGFQQYAIDQIQKALEDALRIALFGDATSYIELTEPFELTPDRKLVIYRSDFGGDSFVSMNRIEVSFEATYKKAGSHAIVIIPDIRGEGTGVVSTGGPPTMSLPYPIEYRQELILRAEVRSGGTEDRSTTSPIPEGFRVKPGQPMPTDWRDVRSAGFTIVNPKDGAELVWVPPGSFMMGSTEDEQARAISWALSQQGVERDWVDVDDESPQHQVELSGFWMYAHEVTNAQFRTFRPNHSSGQWEEFSFNGDQQPVVSIRFDDAVVYCEWAGVALPTEAEWEYACRAGSTSRFWWGDGEADAGRYGNVADRTYIRRMVYGISMQTDDGHVVTAPVGSFEQNPFGLRDMTGNAWEMCADWYDEDYYQRSPPKDPAGPESGEKRVIRGGSYRSALYHYRPAYRRGFEPGRSFAGALSFRPVLRPQPPVTPP